MTTRAKQFDFLLTSIMDRATGLVNNGGALAFFEVGTSTPKNVWTEPEKTNAYTTRTLSSNGTIELYGDGNYKVNITDSQGTYTLDVVKVQSNEYIISTVTSASVDVTPDFDVIVGNTASNSVTCNLDPVATFSRPVLFKKTSANNSLILDADGSELIDAAPTYTLTANSESVLLIPDTVAGKWLKANDIAALATNLVGLTATVSDLNKVPGIVAGTQALGGLDVNGGADVSGTLDIGAGTTRRVAPSGTFVNNTNGNPNISDTQFGITTEVTEATWESIGPTSSGADNETAILNNVPTDADWIVIRAVGQMITSDASIDQLHLHARDFGSSEAAGVNNRLLSLYGQGDGTYRQSGDFTVPVTSGVFEVYWTDSSTNPATEEFGFYLIGWGFNP